MKRIIFAGALLGGVFFQIACSKKSGSANGPDNNPPTVQPPVSYPGLQLALTNDNSKQVEIYDPSVTNWNTTEAKKWSWSPTTTQGFSTTEIKVFGGGTDFKVRKLNVWQDADDAAISDNGMAAGRLCWCTPMPIKIPARK